MLEYDFVGVFVLVGVDFGCLGCGEDDCFGDEQ